MEINRLLLVDTRKTCVKFGLHHASTLNVSRFHSGVREKCPLVRLSFDSSTLIKLIPLFQFLDHTRYPGFVRCWEGLNGLLLFRFQGR